MAKSLAQLRKEVEKLKRDNSKKKALLNKQKKEALEIKQLKAEIKKFKRSPSITKLKKVAKKELSATQLKKRGKATVKGAKATYKFLGKVVNKLDKINI